MTSWNYHERLEKGSGVVTKWLDSSHMSVKTQANLERTLDQLRQLPQTNWTRPHASSLGHHTYVIRFRDVTGKQLRIFGHFYLPHPSFVMTCHGYEKDSVYFPSNYKDLAKEYKLTCDSSFSSETIMYRRSCEICGGKTGSPGPSSS